MEEQLFTRRNKRRTIQQQISAIYEESRRLGVKNPPTLEHHLREVGVSVTEANRRAKARHLEAERQARRESKAVEADVEHVTDRVTSTEPKPKAIKMPRAKGAPKRPEQVFEIIQSNGGATLETIAEKLSVSRDASWGAVRTLIVAGRVKGMRQDGERKQIFVAVDA